MLFLAVVPPLASIDPVALGCADRADWAACRSPGEVLEACAILCFAAVSIPLTVIDIQQQRLPNALVIPGFGVVLGLLLASILLHSTSEIATAPRTDIVLVQTALRVLTLLGSAGLTFILFLVLALVSPNGLGGGDVKLASLVGALLGHAAGWNGWLVGMLSASVLGAAWALVAAFLARRTDGVRIAFGPCLIAGAWIGLLGRGPVDW